MSSTTRNWLVAGASAVALGCFLPAPVLAGGDVIVPTKPEPQRTVSGTFDLYGAWAFASSEDPVSDSFDSDYPLIGGAARVDLPWSENMSLQLDLEGVAAFADGSESGGGPSESDNYGGAAIAAAHLNYREVDQFLVGLFGGGGLAAVNDTSSTGQDPGLYFVGAEGQMYFGDLTGYLQVGYLDSEADDTQEQLTDAFFIRGVGRFYFNGGHSKLEAEASYAHGDQDEGGGGTDEVDIFGWAVQVTHQFHNWGNDGFLAGFLRVEGMHIDEDNQVGGPAEGDFDEYVVSVGISIALNQYSVKTSERTGVALDLPNFGAMVARTVVVDN